MNSYVFIAYLVFWKLVLVEINHGQKFLQISGLGLDSCFVKLENLGTFFQEERQNLVEEAKNKAMDFCERLGISTERRVSPLRGGYGGGGECHEKTLLMQGYRGKMK